MNEHRQARPRLATIISIYLIVEALVPLPIIWIYLFGWFHSLDEGRQSAIIFASMLHRSPLSWVGCALAIVGGIILWQMRRLAFFILATRLGLSLVSSIIRLPFLIALFRRTPHGITDSVMWTISLMIGAQWIVNALIVWYAYRITSPKQFHSAPAELRT